MILKLPTSIVLSFVLLLALAASAVAQQKRQAPVKPQPATAPTPVPTPPPTFDTLLASNSYRIYVEVRSVGQLVRSNSVNEILEPIMSLAGPPKEFRTVVAWLNAHADEVVTSRMLVTGWPSIRDVPNALVAIEFASAEEATRFQQQLGGFLQKMIPPAANPASETGKTEPPPPPLYHMQQAGSLILITPTPLNLKKLRPAGSKLLAEDANFLVARNRFNTESIFVFVDVAEIEKEEEAQRKQYEEARKQAIAANPPDEEAIERAKAAEFQRQIEETQPPVPEEPIVAVEGQLRTLPPDDPSKEPIQAVGPSHADLALGMLFSSFGRVEAKWPQAVGAAISLDGESIDARVLMINAPGEKSDPIPFLPVLSPGPAIAPEAPNILPADTEMLVTLSLDLPQIFTTLMKPPDLAIARASDMQPGKEREFEGPYVALEKRLNIKIKDDLLPLIGSEIVLSVPLTGLDWIQPPQLQASSTPSPSPPASPTPSPSPSPSANQNENANTQSKPGRQIAVALSLKDKEGMRVLLPKLVESLAFKGANSFAQTERRDDTELVSYANVVSYAFIGNFLVISPDVATTRHIVDSYLKHQTLAGEPHFKNYTRWQPRQLHGQVYISPVLMESYRTWIQQPTARVDDQTRAFLTRFSIVAQPVTYSLSNEGFGPLHELHLPKNLVLLLIASTVGALNTPPPEADTPANPPTNPTLNPN